MGSATDADRRAGQANHIAFLESFAADSLAGQQRLQCFNKRTRYRFTTAMFHARKASTTVPDLHTIAAGLNSRSRAHPIGALQETRAGLKGLSRKPGHNIFSAQTSNDDWAFHRGGRSELQFNIGEMSDVRGFRFSVAFSFERSRTLPSPASVLAPKVKLFNDFMELKAEHFADMRMWHFEKGAQGPSHDYMPGPIPWERVKEGVFVFLGKRQRLDRIDYEAILGEAVSQLLEYVFWPGGQVATRLIVVGETAIDNDAVEYLRRLRERFSLPLEYEQVSI